MNTLAIISVGKDDNNSHYFLQCVEDIKLLSNEFDIRVLTDTPKEFQNINCTVYEYDKKIFNYFDKFFFSFKLIRELKTDVLYIDCDSISNFINNKNYHNLNSVDEVLYLTCWPVKINDQWKPWKYLTDLRIEKWTNPIIEFLELERINPSEIETMFEQMFYFPVGLDYDRIQYELEKIKPIFDYCSLYDKNLFNRTIYGHGEGVALSYALYVTNTKKKTIEPPLFYDEYNFVKRKNVL